MILALLKENLITIGTVQEGFLSIYLGMTPCRNMFKEFSYFYIKQALKIFKIFFVISAFIKKMKKYQLLFALHQLVMDSAAFCATKLNGICTQL